MPEVVMYLCAFCYLLGRTTKQLNVKESNHVMNEILQPAPCNNFKTIDLCIFIFYPDYSSHSVLIKETLPIQPIIQHIIGLLACCIFRSSSITIGYMVPTLYCVNMKY